MFSTTLRQLRLARNLTQSDMAKALNISRVAYTNYELGNREPDFGTMARIAAILGTSADYLLGISPAAIAGSGAPADFDQPAGSTLRLLTLAVSSLSAESLEDLRKYIALLTLRDEASQKQTHGHTAVRGRPHDGGHGTPTI